MHISITEASRLKASLLYRKAVRFLVARATPYAIELVTDGQSVCQSVGRLIRRSKGRLDTPLWCSGSPMDYDKEEEFFFAS